MLCYIQDLMVYVIVIPLQRTGTLLVLVTLHADTVIQESGKVPRPQLLPGIFIGSSACHQFRGQRC